MKLPKPTRTPVAAITLILFVLFILALLAIAGCSRSNTAHPSTVVVQEQQAGVLCVDRNMFRVDDYFCRTMPTLYSPWYVSSVALVPVYGTRISGGWNQPPRGYVVPRTAVDTFGLDPKKVPVAKSATATPAPTTKPTAPASTAKPTTAAPKPTTMAPKPTTAAAKPPAPTQKPATTAPKPPAPTVKPAPTR